MATYICSKWMAGSYEVSSLCTLSPAKQNLAIKNLAIIEIAHFNSSGKRDNVIYLTPGSKQKSSPAFSRIHKCPVPFCL